MYPVRNQSFIEKFQFTIQQACTPFIYTGITQVYTQCVGLHTAALFHRCKLHRSPTIVVPGREACRCHPCRDLVIPVAAFQRSPPPLRTSLRRLRRNSRHKASQARLWGAFSRFSLIERSGGGFKALATVCWFVCEPTRRSIPPLSS